MIAAKMEHQLDFLEKVSRRKNGDLDELVGMTIGRLRAEVERVRELEVSGVITLPESVNGGGHHVNA